MRAPALLVCLSLLGCGSAPPPGANPGPAPVAVTTLQDTASVTTALGGMALVPALSVLDDGPCSERAAALRRRLMATELLYEGVPALVAAPDSIPETLPATSTPPGPEFADFDYAIAVGLDKDGSTTPSPDSLDGATSVLLRADRHAAGDAVRRTLRGLRDAGVERVGLLFARPLDAGIDLATPVTSEVFGESCPVDWSWVDKVPAHKRAELWIETAVRAVEGCDCAVDPRHVVALRARTRNESRAVAIPVDVRGTTGARPLVIREGGAWGPAARALYDAIRIDPKRPRGTPVVIDLEAAAPTHALEVKQP